MPMACQSVHSHRHFCFSQKPFHTDLAVHAPGADPAKSCVNSNHSFSCFHEIPENQLNYQIRSVIINPYTRKMAGRKRRRRRQ